MSPFHTLRSVMSLAALLNAVAPVAPRAYAPVDSVPVPRADATAAPADTITLTASPTSFDEDGGGKTLTVTATANSSKSTARNVRVSVGRSGDSAVEGTDYKTIWDFTVHIAANATSGYNSADFYPINRYDRESDETVSVYGALSGHAVTGTSVTLKDDDSWAELSLSMSGGSSLGEEGGAKTFTLRLTAPDNYTPATVNVKVGASGDGATEGTDYQTVDDFSITLPYHGSDVSKSFTVTPSDDNIVEGNEGITVSAQSTNANWDVESPFHITLTDDDATTIALSASPSVSEGAGATSVTVTATAAKTLSAQSTVTVEIGGSGSAGYLTDYSLNDYKLNVVIGANSKKGQSTFNLIPLQDNMVEGSETIGLSGRTTGHSVTGTTLTLTDDDAAPEVDLSLSSSSVSEGTSKATVTVTAAFSSSVTYAANKTVTVSVGGSGTATSGTDYTAVSDFDITISKGDTSGTGSFTLTPTEDQVFEGDETVVVSGTSTGLTVNNDTLTITDNDDAAVTIADASADEGDTITFTVTLDKAVQGGLTVTPSFTSGTAADTDYTANTEALTFTGTAGETQTFKVATAEDAVVEGDETFTVGLTVSNAPSGVTATDTGTGTIEDDESAEVTINDGEADEGDTITFTVTLDKAVQGGLTVTPSFASGTAAATDYTANTEALTFTGTADETQTFKVATVEDAVVEADETFTVSLTVSDAPSGITSTDTGEGTIDNDDAAAVTVNDGEADEGDTITFTVTLDKAVQGGLTVTPSFTSGTAADADYTANTAALTFTGTADETQTFKVATVEDAVVEGDETFTVGLAVSKAPSGITSTDTGEGTIDNDDAAAVTVNDADADEGDTITFTVTLDKAVQGGLTVTPSFTSGTAADTDYTANTAALTFTGTADETQTFKVATVEDAVVEADETFTVGLAVSKAP